METEGDALFKNSCILSQKKDLVIYFKT